MEAMTKTDDTARPARTRRRASHSMEAVISTAVDMLDEAGESALTFRSLAQRLGGGVASIYWYVANKEELLDRATDHVLAGVVADTEAFTGDAADPIENLRSIGHTLFDAVADRPWLGAYLAADADSRPNGVALFERIGAQVMRLGMGPTETFHAASAILSFVIGTAADLGQQPPPQEVVDGSVSREEFLARYADRWRASDPEQFPFLHFVADQFATHDDAAQFRAGLDMLLAGLRQAAGR